MQYNQTKIAFFGTSDRSCPILDALFQNFDLVLCVTKGDSRVGRKQKLKETGVKSWAKEHSVNFIEVGSLKDNDLSHVIEQINSSNIELAIVADFSLFIPSELIELLKGQLINIHFSLLPLYRGASPVQFAILNGDDTTGITYQLVHEKMDKGAVINQVGYKMLRTENSGELYEILFDIASKKLPQTLNDYLSGNIQPTEQHEESATYTFSPSHPKSTHIYKEDAEINWKDKPEIIERKVRAFNPWPIAWTSLKDFEKQTTLNVGKIKLKDHVNKELKLKIHKAKLEENKLKIQVLQVEGKGKIMWEEFRNGYLEG